MIKYPYIRGIDTAILNVYCGILQIKYNHFNMYVKIAEWPPFGRELPIWFIVCSLCILLIVILVIFHFGFEGGTLVLIA